jgi:hypothetical protein
VFKISKKGIIFVCFNNQKLNKFMHIANPIYDVVLDFIMEDGKAAKSFLSAIIGEEIVELESASRKRIARKPSEVEEEQKRANEEKHGLFCTVCRFYRSARIAISGGGFKTVLIELQKAKLASDIMRFRSYQERNYRYSDNTCEEQGDRTAQQIYCIFLLIDDICIPERTVILADDTVKDVTTNEDLSTTNEFIQSLHHRSWIVQINQLKQRRRNDLEKMLSIFDQKNRKGITPYTLNVNEEDFPEQECHPVLRRLRIAHESEEIETQMEYEDDYWKEVQCLERRIAKQDKMLELQDKMLELQEKILEEQNKASGKDRKVIESFKKQLAEMQSSYKRYDRQKTD